MKHPYLLFHTAGLLHTFVRRYESPFTEEPALFSTLKHFHDEPFGEAAAAWAVQQSASAPLILGIEGAFAYGWIVLRKCRYLVGPVRFDEPVFFSHLLTLKDLGLQEDALTHEWLSSVPLCPFNAFTDQILLLYNYRRKGNDPASFLTRQQLMAVNCVDHRPIKKIRNDIALKILDNLDNQIMHNPYNQEVRERQAIREGNIEGLRQAVGEDFTGRYGVLSKDPLRQEINMGIVTITLASRAAIEGGLHFERAFYMSDMVIQQLEAARDPVTAKHIYRNAEFRLAEMVHELNSHREKNERKAGISGGTDKTESGIREDSGTAAEEAFSHTGRKKDVIPRKAGDRRSVKTEGEREQGMGHSREGAPNNRHISRCKDYIFAHLHEKLTVAQVADAVSLDRSYLSKLFSRCEGISMKQYILNEKLHLARNMLTYSAYPYSRIAAYLGFSSQSHLGTEFRKNTGMTLKEYRDTYGSEDFIQNHIKDQSFRS